MSSLPVDLRTVAKLSENLRDLMASAGTEYDHEKSETALYNLLMAMALFKSVATMLGNAIVAFQALFARRGCQGKIIKIIATDLRVSIRAVYRLSESARAKRVRPAKVDESASQTGSVPAREVSTVMWWGSSDGEKAGKTSITERIRAMFDAAIN